MDPLHGLPHSQHQAVNITCDAISWLLQDEIVSELRHIGPVTTSMLKQVEQHVKQSEEHSSCISRQVRLQFVSGAEQSLELFVKEFERINLPEYVLKNADKYYYLTSFAEQQVAVTSPLALGGDTGDLERKREERDAEKEATTPKADTGGENGDHKTTAPLEVETTLESHTAANDGLLAVYVAKQSTVTQQDVTDSDASMAPLEVAESQQGSPGENERITPSSKPPHLGQVGKQHSADEEPDNTAASTPVKDAYFTSSAGSTPVGKLIIPAVDVSTADSSKTEVEDDETGSPSPCTPRQEQQTAAVEELCLKFWLVMGIFGNEVNIFFHQR